MKIHFIGLGNMGLPMAVNLSKKFDVAVFDLSTQQCQAAEQAQLSTLLQEDIGHNADVVISALPAGKHMRAAIIDNHLGEKVNASCLFIDCTTADYDSAIALHEHAAAHSHICVDSPMSGGIKGAQNATLTFMVGGDDDAVERAKPILYAMGQNIFHAGKAGAGQIAKICNNMMLAISMAGTCEALNLGSRLGLDVKILSNIMHQASGSNWVLDRYNPYPKVMDNAPASNAYQGGFKTGLMLKDLGLAETTAINNEVPIHLGSLVRSLYAQHAQQHSELDFSSILKHYTGE